MNDITLLSSLFELMHSIKSELNQEVKKQNIDLALTHTVTLKIIGKYPECTPQEIAVLLNRDKAQITRVTKDLLAEQLIIKEPNPADKRSHFLRLTDQGHKVLERVAPSEQKIARWMTCGMEQDEIEKITVSLKNMASNLKKISTIEAK